MKTTLTILSVIASLTATTVMAKEHGARGTHAPGINKRMENQKKRIQHKLDKGKITQEQADQMNKNVDSIQAKEKEMSADGSLTKGERKELRQELRKNSKEIQKTGQSGDESKSQ